MYIRLQTWFPFTIQVHVHGHEWLARHPVGLMTVSPCWYIRGPPLRAEADCQLSRWTTWLVRRSSSERHSEGGRPSSSARAWRARSSARWRA